MSPLHYVMSSNLYRVPVTVTVTVPVIVTVTVPVIITVIVIVIHLSQLFIDITMLPLVELPV